MIQLFKLVNFLFVQEVHEWKQKPWRPDINDSLSDLVSSDPFLSSREMAETLHTSHTTMLSNLRDLGKTLKHRRWIKRKQ